MAKVGGRALFLSVSKLATRTTFNGLRYEQRSVTLDVELPGMAPYEVSLDAYIPTFVRALPGASVDVQVDPQNPRDVTIVGPLGSAAWIGLVPQVAANPVFNAPGTGSSSGAGCVIAIIVIAAVIGGIIAAASSSSHSSTEKKKSSSAPEATASPICKAAIKCCTVVNGGGGCSSFATKSDSACKVALKNLQKQAEKLDKTCE